MATAQRLNLPHSTGQPRPTIETPLSNQPTPAVNPPGPTTFTWQGGPTPATKPQGSTHHD